MKKEATLFVRFLCSFPEKTSLNISAVCPSISSPYLRTDVLEFSIVNSETFQNELHKFPTPPLQVTTFSFLTLLYWISERL